MQGQQQELMVEIPAQIAANCVDIVELALRAGSVTGDALTNVAITRDRLVTVLKAAQEAASKASAEAGGPVTAEVTNEDKKSK